MAQGISLIVGLGNPGQQYRHTRHNAGAMFLESLCNAYHGTLRPDSKFFGDSERISVDGEDVRLLFPTTYMNHSGKAVAACCQYFRIPPEQVLVAYDELDLPLGTARLKDGGGAGGHNGVRDIIAALGENGFKRLRIGIGHPGEASKVLNYVLSPPSRSEAESLQREIDKAIELMPLLVKGKLQIAMNKLHTRPPDNQE